MAYDVILIDRKRVAELNGKVSESNRFKAKADINGICIELSTPVKEYIDMWTDNFYSMSDRVRPHGRIFCIDDPGTDLHAEYDLPNYTVYLFNFDYYGWIKSVALGIAGNILEGQGTFPVHGATLSIDGTGVTLIAPSKTGKTTQSWGLLRMENTHLITDDWYFVEFGSGRPAARGSEKNCYIDADIGDVWEEYRPLVKGVKFDNKGRGIGNVRWVAGEGSVIEGTSIRYVILMKRDYSDPVTVRRMDTGEALEYLSERDFCNPHQLVRDSERMVARRDFFKKYLGSCTVIMVNTIRKPEETQDLIRAALKDGLGN